MTKTVKCSSNRKEKIEKKTFRKKKINLDNLKQNTTKI